jgi:GTP-dependent phosphoenolpyruvate carboxykinase
VRNLLSAVAEELSVQNAKADNTELLKVMSYLNTRIALLAKSMFLKNFTTSLKNSSMNSLKVKITVAQYVEYTKTS